MSGSTPALALRGVTRRYRVGLVAGHRTVLAGVDLELAPGERLGLVGPNGSGKSTLLRIASGIECASSGSVRAFGAGPRSDAARRRIGIVPEGAPFPRELGARACLELCASLQGMNAGRCERRAACARMLERIGLAGERAPLGRYSQGMLRRFALAQAFVHEPDLVLLDEPTIGLDASGHVVLTELLDEARARGVALLLCSHQLDEVLTWTDEVAVLAGGRLFGDALALRAPGDRVRLEVEGLDEAAFGELASWVDARGGRVLSRFPTAAALIELYGAASSERSS
jgi:ABC-type multidrug transport system ATPase subunit